MPIVDTVVCNETPSSFRVEQIATMFDVDLHAKLEQRFHGEFPDQSENWRIGLIVGASGSGKSTLARKAFGEGYYVSSHWGRRAVIDEIGPQLTTQEVARIMSTVGFGSVTSWLKPYAVLSTGEKMRCDLCRALCSGKSLIVFDEFTSVVDRQVAKIACLALRRMYDREAQSSRFIAVSCHRDVIDWLCPDWMFDTDACELTRRCLQRCRIECEVSGGKVSNAWSSGQMWRGVGLILKGRDPRDAWAFTQRFCGV